MLPSEKKALPIPLAFIWRKIHSLMGLGLTIFLFFHLYTNSQAAFWIGDDGKSYIQSVNSIQEIPYLRIFELLVLAVPLAIHGIFGIYYLKTGLGNAYLNSGKDPYLPEYERNRAYTWQRITSWLLLVGILFHVAHMRFIEAPFPSTEGTYLVSLTMDDGLNALASRLKVPLQKEPSGLVIARASDFGTAELLMVRETFKSPIMMFLYTIFVLAACFHAFNGLWTFSITWGISLSERTQSLFLRFTTFLMFLTTFLGLSTIYLTYYVNLRG